MRRQRSTLFYLALSYVILVVLVALIATFWIEYDAVSVRTGDRLLPPGSRTASGQLALLGTDQLGRDLFEQIIEGARISLIVGFATLALAGSVGVFIGMASGYFGGAFDRIMMRLADVQLAFPSILLAILIAAVIGPSVRNVIITLSLTRWVVFARVARSVTLSTKKLEYVEATKNLGAGHLHIFRTCVLPACLSAVLVVGTVELGLVVIAESSLSFLGLGTPQNMPSWGVTIANGRDYLDSAWWISTLPGVALALLVISIGIIGDTIRDKADPYMAGLPSKRR